jgi:hypothetical protein
VNIFGSSKKFYLLKVQVIIQAGDEDVGAAMVVQFHKVSIVGAGGTDDHVIRIVKSGRLPVHGQGYGIL